MTGYVLKMFPRFSETFILSEILELERRGERIAVFSLKKPDDGCFHAELAELRVRAQYLPEHVRSSPSVYLRAHLRAALAAPRRYAATLGVALRFGAEAREGFMRAPLVADGARVTGCTRLHAHFASLPAITAFFASRLSGLPFTFTAHAKDIFLQGRSGALLRTLLHAAERVITVSDFNVDYLRGIGGAVLPPERIVRIYNGIDLERFRPSQGPMADPPLVLAVGRLVEKKGFGDLVEALGRLREENIAFTAKIVGKGPEEGALRRRIAERRLMDSVELTGPLPRGRVAELLARTAVLAVPCVVGRDGNRDGLPTVLLEAMAAGVPAVATTVTGIPEAIDDGQSGRLVGPGDVAAFARALREVLEDPARRAGMGRRARLRAERDFDLRANVGDLARLFHDAGALPSTGFQPSTVRL